MTDILLAGISGAQLVAFSLYVRYSERERRRLLNAVLSRSPQEFAFLQKADTKADPKPHRDPQPPIGL